MHLNYLAIFVATLSAFALGAVWYAPPVFGKAWMRANNFGDNPPKSNPAKVFPLAFLLTLVMAFNLAAYLGGPTTTARFGAAAGFAAGFGWCLMGIGICGLFESKPWTYALINGGYLTVALTLMGFILGAWR
jgi:Protein of unknown function (DUF1761)